MAEKKRKGQKKMDLNAFLQDKTMGADWADEVTDLPTAPAAALASTLSYSATTSFQGQSYARENEVEVPIPDEAPYTAFIGNLSFNVTDNDISLFFGEGTVKSVRMVMDMQTQRPKGYGYVEFEDRQGLVNALKMNGESLQNRQVRINVAEGSNLKLI
jgi:translation initiation factor 4B